MEQKQKKWYWLQSAVDHKVELRYNSLEDINYLNKNIYKKNDLYAWENTHNYNDNILV